MVLYGGVFASFVLCSVRFSFSVFLFLHLCVSLFNSVKVTPVCEIAVHLAVAVMSLMTSFLLSFFPRDVEDEIWNF